MPCRRRSNGLARRDAPTAGEIVAQRKADVRFDDRNNSGRFGVQKHWLVHTVYPVYPQITDKRVDGTVVLHVVIGENGAVKGARYVSGPANLLNSAVKAVLQWRYEPTLVNGAAVEEDTTVSVVFPTLPNRNQRRQAVRNPRPERFAWPPAPMVLSGAGDTPDRRSRLHGLQVKVDKRPAVPWPQRESLKIGDCI
jgi:TonB family protein